MIVVLTRAITSLLRTEEALAILSEVVPQFEDIAGTPEHANLLLRLANIYWIADALDDAIAWADKALAEAERHDLVPSIVDGLIIKGGALGYLGRGYEGISTMRGAYALAEDSGNKVGMARALTNLSDAQIARDPRAALETARTGLEQVRRIGRADYLGILVLNATYPALRTGDWDWAVEQGRELESSAVDEVDRANGTVAPLIITAARGEDVSARMAEVQRVLSKGTDAQALASIRDTHGHVAFVEGRLDQAFDDLMAAGGMISWSAPTAYLTAARAALWLKDPVRARAALERLDTTTHGPAIAAAHDEIEAGLLALAGDTGAASLRYRQVLEAWRDLGLPWDEALTAIDMAILIGLGNPEVETAAAVARDTFARLGAVRLAARLAETMAWSDGAGHARPPSHDPSADAPLPNASADPAVPTS